MSDFFLRHPSDDYCLSILFVFIICSLLANNNVASKLHITINYHSKMGWVHLIRRFSLHTDIKQNASSGQIDLTTYSCAWLVRVQHIPLSSLTDRAHRDTCISTYILSYNATIYLTQTVTIRPIDKSIAENQSRYPYEAIKSYIMYVCTRKED